MKAASAIFLAVLGLQAPLAASSENFTNFVRQYQQGSGVYWDMQNVAPAGSAASLHPLDESGALFQLWTIEKNTGKDYLLDQKTVGAYMPKADIKVITQDPYEKYPRTRSDQPFSVHITVSDLVTGTAGVPQAASSVLAEHHLAPYAKGQTSIPASIAISGTPVGSGYLTENRLYTFDFQQSMLQAPDTKKPIGEEHFVVHALSDGSFAQTQIAAGFVQVWPVATGAIGGIKHGERISFHPPPLTLVLKDLYPGSYTRLRATRPGSDYETTFERSEFLLAEEPTSTDKIIILTDYGHVFPEDGTYLLELITTTPFGTDVLSAVTVPVDRTLQVRTMQANIASE